MIDRHELVADLVADIEARLRIHISTDAHAALITTQDVVERMESAGRPESEDARLARTAHSSAVARLNAADAGLKRLLAAE